MDIITYSAYSIVDKFNWLFVFLRVKMKPKYIIINIAQNILNIMNIMLFTFNQVFDT